MRRARRFQWYRVALCPRAPLRLSEHRRAHRPPHLAPVLASAPVAAVFDVTTTVPARTDSVIVRTRLLRARLVAHDARGPRAHPGPGTLISRPAHTSLAARLPLSRLRRGRCPCPRRQRRSGHASPREQSHHPSGVPRPRVPPPRSEDGGAGTGADARAGAAAAARRGALPAAGRRGPDREERHQARRQGPGARVRGVRLRAARFHQDHGTPRTHAARGTPCLRTPGG